MPQRSPGVPVAETLPRSIEATWVRLHLNQILIDIGCSGDGWVF